jgi:hypothetical protein
MHFSSHSYVFHVPWLSYRTFLSLNATNWDTIGASPEERRLTQTWGRRRRAGADNIDAGRTDLNQALQIIPNSRLKYVNHWGSSSEQMTAVRASGHPIDQRRMALVRLRNWSEFPAHLSADIKQYSLQKICKNLFQIVN